ncbi:MAG TPA: hypothetical protein VMK12_27940 [Anaeromyxobacteraceae bacterium]|nr:hypothetical protein [Anaeromyxobacteraceae bacterium]
MKEDPARNVQLLLTVPAFTLERMSDEVHRRLVAALAELLLSVALGDDTASGGGGDEREDP